MIIFKSCKWRNLLSTGNQFTELDFSSSGTLLIVGENGAGKSTVLDALSFALFGKPYRNINKPQLVNSINSRDCLVEVIFNVGSDEYVITRGIKPNIFEIRKNGEIQHNIDAKGQQEAFERQVLKCTYKSFCQVVVLGAATFLPFMQLPAWQRRLIIEDLLDLQVFTTMNNLRKEKYNGLMNEHRESITNISIFNNTIELLRRNRAENDTQKQLDIDEKHLRINNTLTEIEVLKKEIIDTDAEIKTLDTVNMQVGELLKKRSEYVNFKTELEIKRDNLIREIGFFKNNESCPTCAQGIEHEHKNNAINIRMDKIAELNEGLELLESKLTPLKEKMERLSERVDQKWELVTRLKILKSTLTNKVDYIESLRKDISRIEIRDNEKLNTDIHNAVLERDLHVMVRDGIEQELLLLQEAGELLKDTGIKAQIVKKYVPTINELISGYMEDMEFMCKFELNENFEERILSRYMDEFSYESFSEGQKQRIDLSLLFTWREVARRRNSISTNLLLLDEVFDRSLDANGIDFVSRIVDKLSSDNKVVIISHRDQLQDRFTNVIKFGIRKNFSEIIR